MSLQRIYPVGAEIFPHRGVHFRVWAPDHKQVDLILEKAETSPLFLPMKKEKQGYFSLLTDRAAEGTLYRYRLSNSRQFYADPGNYKAMSALFLLSPNTPLIFQGQEFNSTQPFHYFADHSPDISSLVRKGRKNELAQFPRLDTTEIRKVLPDPDNPLTFTHSKLNYKDRENNQKIYALFRDLIELRKKNPVFAKMQSLKIDGAVLGQDAFLIRYFGEELGDRLLIINFGADFSFNPAPEPLLVAGLNQEFVILWSSESVQYGGEGTPPINIPYWKMLGHSATVLQTTPEGKRKRSL